MKHFVEARTDALNALAEPSLTALVDKIALVIDLRGKIRVLAKPLTGSDVGALRERIAQHVGTAADVFWDSEMWIEDADAKPADKAIFSMAWSHATATSREEKVFLIDRRLSKDAWFGASLEPPWPLNEHTPPIVSFYSFKGGVGRTTALAAVVANLARRGKKVVALDFDLEAPGAGLILAPDGVAPALGIVDYLLEYPIAPRGSLDLGEFSYTCDDAKIIAGGEPSRIVPSVSLDQWYLEKLARINYEYLYRTAEHADDSSPLHSLLKQVKQKFEPDIILVDSRAGFHDLGGLSLSGLAHLQVLFGLNSMQSWNGLALAISHLGKEMVMRSSAQRACLVVQAMTPSQAERERSIRTFKERSFQVFSDNYYDSAENTEAEFPVPDLESTESPHFPVVLTWDNRIQGYSAIRDVADFLTEKEYESLTRAILERVGRGL